MRILEPGVARRTFADHRAQAGIGDHVGPRRRCRRAFTQHHHVFAAVVTEAAGTVVELAGATVGQERPRVVHVLVMRGGGGQAGLNARVGDDRQPRRLLHREFQFFLHRLRHKGRNPFRGGSLAPHLRNQRAVFVADHRACHRLQQDTVLVGHVLHRPHENAAGAVEQAGLRTGGHHAQDLVLQLLPVAGLAVVPDHQVGVETLLAPVGMGLHQLPDQFHVLRVGDLEQHDGQVARDGMAPQPGLSTLVLLQHARPCTQQGTGIQHVAGQALIELRLGLGGVDLAAHHLAVRPGQVEHAVGQAAVTILVQQCLATGAVGADAIHHVQLHGLLGLQHHPHADGHDRVEHRTVAAGEVGVGGQCLRGARRVATPQEARPVGFVGDRRHVGVVHRHQMEHPRWHFVVRTRPARAQHGLLGGQDLALHEQVAEGRVRIVGGRRCQYHFGIGGDFHGARATAAVGQPQAPEFDVVLGGDGHLQVALATVKRAAEFGLGVGEDGLVVVHRHAGGLVGGRPEVAAVHVAQVAERAPGIGGAVLAPAGEREVAVAAVAAAGMGEHAVVAAVGQQLHFRARAAGLAQHAQGRFVLGGGGVLAQRFDFMRMEHADARNALLQQQQGGLELDIGHEAALHRLVAQQVIQRQQAHALVVGHERTQQHVVVPRWDARGGVVDRLVHSEATGEAQSFERLKVLAGRFRRHHQRHHAGIGCDDPILPQAALQPQPRHAERAVLVVQARIDGVVAGLGHAPWQVEASAVDDLGFHRMPRGLVEQGVRVAGHHQLRHEVLEHRATPRQQRRRAVDLGKQAAEREPALLRELALGDGHEGAQPRFGGQQVVEAVVEAVVVDVVADGEQLAGAVEQEPIFHQRELPGAVRQVLQLRDARACVRTGRAGQVGQLAQGGYGCIGVRAGIDRDLGERRTGGMAFGSEQGRPVQVTVLRRCWCRPLRQHGVGQAGQLLQAG